MHITELELSNFRGFRHLKLHLPPKLAVLIGNNGSGKSSVLQALGLLIQHFTQPALMSEEESLELKLPKGAYIADIPFEKSDINVNANKATIGITYSLSKNKFKFSLTNEIGKPNYFIPNSEYIKTIKEKISNQPHCNIPLLLFFNISRFLSSDTSKAQEKRYAFAQFAAYENAVSAKPKSFNEFVNWFRHTEDAENEMRLRQDASYRHPKLEVVRRAIENFMAAMQTTHFSNLHIKRTMQTDNNNFNNISTEGELYIQKGAELLKMSQLSDGEKMTMVMIADIARRLSIANPSLTDPLQGEGVVLIDEIDAHLHPKWQRRIIPALNNTFPNLQFIVTTHSPQVLSMVSSNNIFLLENGEVFSVEATKGRDTNDILETVMHTDESPIQSEIKELARYITAKDYEKAEKLLHRLMQEVEGDYAPLLRYKSLIERKKTASIT